MIIKLRAGEKLYLNGAVIKADRKVVVELLNDATFLLETHIMQPEDASTPLRQLYFVLQMQLMDSAGAANARKLFQSMLNATLAAFAGTKVSEGLDIAAKMVAENRLFDALKTVRALFPLEAEIMSNAAKSRAA